MTTFVFTVLSGVIIFVAGQFVLKLVIEPVQELKKSLGFVSYILLLHQAKLTNATSNNEIAYEIKSKSADILSKSSVVIGDSRLFLKIFGLPSKQNIKLASKELNIIYYGMLNESKDFQDSAAYNGNKIDFAKKNVEAIKNIAELLQLQTSYE